MNLKDAFNLSFQRFNPLHLKPIVEFDFLPILQLSYVRYDATHMTILVIDMQIVSINIDQAIQYLSFVK